MTQALVIVGALIFGLLGIAHGWYTLRDSQTPRQLIPDDPAVLAAMQATGLRLSAGGTTVWKAWLGFNYSHALGLLMFSVGCTAFALSLRNLAPPRTTLMIPVFIGITYLWLAVRYWFWVPALGIAIGTLFLFAAWLNYSG